MDLKVAFVIVCLCALAITSTEAGIPKCCVKTRRMVRKDVLMNIERQYEQLSGGICDIPALVLYIKGMKKPICASPKLKPMVDRLMEKRYNKLKAAP